ncbi:MAG: hypothetical protein R3C19_23485 [Planctomycetaceae bacterium]
MTLPSRRKHRITRWSITPATIADLFSDRVSARIRKLLLGSVLATCLGAGSLYAADGDAARIRIPDFLPPQEVAAPPHPARVADRLSGPSGFRTQTPAEEAFDARSRADRLVPVPETLQPLPHASSPVTKSRRLPGVPAQSPEELTNDVRRRATARELADSLVPPMSSMPVEQPSAARMSRVPLMPPLSAVPDDEFRAPVLIPDAVLPQESAPVSEYSSLAYPESFAAAHARRVHMIVQDEESWTLAEKWHMQSVRWNQQNRRVSNMFVEFYEPVDVLPDNLDDYGMKVVVASGTAQQPRFGAQSSSELLSRKITDIRPSLDYAWGSIPKESLPDDFEDRMDRGEYVAVRPPQTVLQWAPTNLWHNPLYFEDPALERYGHTYNRWVQPFASGGRFMTQLVGLPYQMTLHPMHAREYTLGWYRPGECAPKLKYQIPFNEEATVMQTLVVVGLILVMP